MPRRILRFPLSPPIDAFAFARSVVQERSVQCCGGECRVGRAAWSGGHGAADQRAPDARPRGNTNNGPRNGGYPVGVPFCQRVQKKKAEATHANGAIGYDCPCIVAETQKGKPGFKQSDVEPSKDATKAWPVLLEGLRKGILSWKLQIDLR